MRQARVHVLMAAPMPPAVGGMATVAGDLCASSLGRDFAIETFDTGKKTPPGRTVLSAIGVRLALWRRWWALLGRTPAIAHIHTCSGLSFFLDLALVVLARLRGVPVVLHIHGGRFDGFVDSLDPLRRRVVRAGARLADRVVVLSEGWRERLATRLPGARLAVVENGVPVGPAFGRRDGDGLPLILFVGALTRAKGVLDLVRALAASAPARLALVGPESEPGIADALDTLARELGVGERVELPGVATGRAKVEWLQRASLFVLPSHAEGLPVSLLEAMAAGLPVVATRVGAIPAVVEDGRTGFLVEPGDVGGLARAIDDLVRDPLLRADLGRRAREACRARFSIDRTADALRTIYLDIAGPAIGATA